MNGNLVTFKGNKDGIYIHIKEGNFKAIKEQLDKKLKNAGSFFSGGKVINFKGKKLTNKEKEELEHIISEKYGIDIEKENNNFSSEKIDKSNKDMNFFQGINEGKTKFIRATIRSGQEINYEGNIVILGDINPGGVVIAKGNIVVLGALRGVAIAGSDGNKEAIVAAFNLQPTQLKIGDILSRSPDEDEVSFRRPEIAYIRDDSIIVEPYLPKK
ncbi:septum site-determining protein MinC [Caldisalinibacter kiritimatiensis]|uniref:Probable septum site-determining protein MinC n=1 Tax=Caldisalinibacter kiritimatiensis TaxID=1304284 RepID=R1CSZ5_9FIRM|nr:septum site-determining protein MinC [Caldisalinibacter kiritimatiensis]EOC99823.1 Septum site-determining protein MinC [Caldisalinibacter kiritimatiensis]